MKENRCFPEGTDVKRVMDLYLQVLMGKAYVETFNLKLHTSSISNKAIIES